MLALGVMEVAWFCVVHDAFGVFTLCITCDFQINALYSLPKISAEMTDKTSSFGLLSMFGAISQDILSGKGSSNPTLKLNKFWDPCRDQTGIEPLFMIMAFLLFSPQHLCNESVLEILHLLVPFFLFFV